MDFGWDLATPIAISSFGERPCLAIVEPGAAPATPAEAAGPA